MNVGGANDTLVLNGSGNVVNMTGTNGAVMLTSNGGSDTFVFNFATVGHDTVANFDPDADVLQFSAALFASASDALDAAQDDEHGNTVIAFDADDTITLLGVTKMQLSLIDFHVA